MFPRFRQFEYDNGVGSAVDRFAIDLYEAEGTGECGTYVTSICDKESIGCKDSGKLNLLVSTTAVFSWLSWCQRTIFVLSFM